MSYFLQYINFFLSSWTKWNSKYPNSCHLVEWCQFPYKLGQIMIHCNIKYTVYAYSEKNGMPLQRIWWTLSGHTGGVSIVTNCRTGKLATSMINTLNWLKANIQQWALAGKRSSLSQVEHVLYVLNGLPSVKLHSKKLTEMIWFFLAC